MILLRSPARQSGWCCTPRVSKGVEEPALKTSFFYLPLNMGSLTPGAGGAVCSVMPTEKQYSVRRSLKYL